MISKSLIRLVSKKIFTEKKSLSSLINQSASKSSQFVCNSNTIKFNFSTLSQKQSSLFVFNAENQQQLLNLELQYRSQQNIMIFQDRIKSSTGILDQMYIFKIFKVIEGSPFKQEAYEQFFNLINKNLKRKSDNILLLLATIKQRIARNYQASKNYTSAFKLLQGSLQILEQCMVPQLLPYYSVYREYGLLNYQMGNFDKAKQILAQSVNALDDFVSHSDDNVSTNHYCLKQATAYNALAQVDRENSKKWIDKSLNMWESYGQNKCNLTEYAKTVAQNLKILLAQDKQKGQAYYHFNLYKFETNEMKDLLKKAKAEASSQ